MLQAETQGMDRRSTIELEYLKLFGNCRTIKEFTSRIESTLTKMGFVIHGISKIGGSGTNEVQVSTLSNDMVHSYFESGFFTNDLMVSAIMNNHRSEPFYRNQILSFMDNLDYNTPIFTENREITRLYNSHGYEDVVVIEEEAHNQVGKIALSLVAYNTPPHVFRQKIEQNKIRLRTFLQVIDYIGTRKFPNQWVAEEETKEIKFSPKPLELVRLMVIEDMRIEEAAYLLGKSRHSCNKQLRELKDRLGVSTLHAASHQLTRMGLI